MDAMLKNKIALVTGGNSGMGASIVALFQQHGASVAILDITEATKDTADDHLYIKCNIASEEEVTAAVKQVIDKWGKLDILVNCAGVMDGLERIDSMSNKTWERCFAVNVTGPMYLTRLCIPQFLKQDSKGVIINICSTGAVRGAAAGVAYTASKHALLGMSRNTAWMYAKDGIRCNVVLPGGTETNIMQNSGVTIDQTGLETLRPFHACMPSVCKPGEIANAVLFLATAPSVNGAELAVDHGWLAT